MNYITLLNNFREQRKAEPLNANEIVLWFILVEYCNEIGWIEWFTVTNGVVQGLSNLSHSSFHRARNELARKGYIKYREGSGNKAGKYLIVDFGTQTGTQSETQSETQIERKQGTLYKHKRKPKQKEKENIKKKFIPPTLEEVIAYCAKRQNDVNAKQFYDYYSEGGWVDGYGKQVVNWKQKMIAVWEKEKPSGSEALPKPGVTPEQAKKIRGE